jgi:hypothetical protein
MVRPATRVPLNNGQEYFLEIDSPVTTLYLFFRRRFVEEVCRNFGSSANVLPDAPNNDDERLLLALFAKIRSIPVR